MNNRMLARIVAAVMAIAMLGSISFAASISGDVINVGAPSDSAYTGQTQKTVVAYFADTADSTEPAAEDIIAIYQADGASTQVPATIHVETSKNTNADYLVVRYGGSDVEASKFAIGLTNNEDSGILEAATSFTVGNTEYTNVAHFTRDFALRAEDGVVTSYGFKLWQTSGVHSTSEEKPLYFTSDDIRFSGEGEYSFDIVIVATGGQTLVGKSFYTTEQ